MDYTLQKLIDTIRQFNRDSIVQKGLKYLWVLNKGISNIGGLELDRRSQILILHYGSKIITLGLLEASSSIILVPNGRKECSLKDFITLCELYLEAFSNSQYGWNVNPKAFINALAKDDSQKSKSIPQKYFEENMSDVILQACEINALIQLQNTQILKGDSMRITQTYEAILAELQKQTEGDKDITNKIEEIEHLKALRSGWILAAIAIKYNGFIDFVQIPDDFKYKDDVDKESCLKVARKLSEIKDFNSLKEGWNQIRAGLITQDHSQKLISFLQSIPAVICQNRGCDIFYIPNLAIYLESLGFYLLNTLVSATNEKRCKKIGSKIGNAIESHVGRALEYIFEVKVEKIPKKEGNPIADFYIKLDECDLIIEVKKSIGYASTVDDTAKMWHRLYAAYKQCAASSQKYKSETKPNIAIIVILEEAGLTPSSFQIFAEKSGITKDLGIEYIKIMSWYQLETVLSMTSISQFISTLLKDKERYNNLSLGVTVEEAIYPLEFPVDTPAHSFQYLENSGKRLALPTLSKKS